MRDFVAATSLGVPLAEVANASSVETTDTRSVEVDSETIWPLNICAWSFDLLNVTRREVRIWRRRIEFGSFWREAYWHLTRNG